MNEDLHREFSNYETQVANFPKSDTIQSMIFAIILFSLVCAAFNPDYLINTVIKDLTGLVHTAMVSEIQTWPVDQYKLIKDQVPAIEDSFSNQSSVILKYRSKQYVETLNGTLDQSEIMVTITLEDIANRYLQIIASPDNIPDSPFMSYGVMNQLELIELGSSKFEEETDVRVKVGLPTYDEIKEKGIVSLKWYFTKISKFNSSAASLF